MKNVSIAVLVCLLAGCSDSAEDSVVDGGQDMGADAAVDMATDGGPDMAADMAAICPDPIIPPTLPPTASARFRFTGAGRVAELAMNCAAFTIAEAAGEQVVPVAIGGCPCGCLPQQQRLLSFSTAASTTEPELVWVGAVLVPYADCVECPSNSARPGPTPTTGAVGTAAPAGDYTATFLVFDEDDSLGGDVGSMTYRPGSEADLCPTDNARSVTPPRRVSVNFTLPESGEVVVNVPILEPSSD
jgi:hypothetical protein